MLRQKLEAGLPIPPSTKRDAVLGVMEYFVNELRKKLDEGYLWLASCTVAVQAGQWGGNRRLRRRLKLAEMIAKCAAFLDLPNPVDALPKGWERHGLRYGYGVFAEIQKATGASTLELVLLCPRTVIGPDGKKVQSSHLQQLQEAAGEAPAFREL